MTEEHDDGRSDDALEDELTQATARARTIRNLMVAVLVGLAVLRRLGVIDVPFWVLLSIALVASLLPLIALAQAMASKMPPDTRS